MKRFVVLTECTQEYAEHNLDCSEIRGIPVRPLSWREVDALARKGESNGSHAEKRLLHAAPNLSRKGYDLAKLGIEYGLRRRGPDRSATGLENPLD